MRSNIAVIGSFSPSPKGALLPPSRDSLQGTWPFGVVELIWAAVVFKRWLALRHASPAQA
jgi:hypothetical protein